jgi:hypothetical protein
MTYYVGQPNDIDQLLGANNPRYFYALRRTDDGQLFFSRIDQLKDADTITINNPGPASEDYNGFDYGVDYFDGRLEEDHSRPHDNLQWDQYRWDSKNANYYINEQGEFVVRINQAYIYPEDSIVS